MSDTEIIAFAAAVRSQHDPRVQAVSPGRCALCSFTRHPCDTYELADTVLTLLARLDDPLYPPMPLDPQPFRDWLHFVELVARPLVEAEHVRAEQAAMLLYRLASPYFICTALVMAANRVRDE